MIGDEQLRALRRRAHLHTDRCYGRHEPCGEHHAHDDRCGERPIVCLQPEDPQLVRLLGEVDRLRTIEEAARALSAKLALVQASDEYRAVWTIFHVHGYRYTGLQFGDELKTLDAAIAAIIEDPR